MWVFGRGLYLFPAPSLSCLDQNGICFFKKVAGFFFPPFALEFHSFIFRTGVKKFICTFFDRAAKIYCRDLLSHSQWVTHFFFLMVENSARFVPSPKFHFFWVFPPFGHLLPLLGKHPLVVWGFIYWLFLFSLFRFLGFPEKSGIVRKVPFRVYIAFFFGSDPQRTQ